MKTRQLWGLVLCGLMLRLILDVLLWQDSYFYGKPWDTFTRTDLAWQWSQAPYFGVSDYYWLPLQFWLVGLGYKFLAPFTPVASLLVPVAVNHVFFTSSLAVTGWVAAKLSGPRSAVFAILLAATLAGDVWATYSGLSEPVSTFFALALSAVILAWFQAGNRRDDRAKLFLLASVLALLATATHYVGWFLSVLLTLIAGLYLFQCCWQAWRESELTPFVHYIRQFWPYALALVVIWIFPVVWMYVNWAKFGDPLHFTQVAAAHQAAFAGQVPLLRRVAMPFGVTWLYAPAMITVALVAVPFALHRKGWVWGTYLLPGGFHFVILILTSALAWSAADQEPRYVVFYVWMVIPFVSTWVAELTIKLHKSAQIAGWMILLILILSSLWQMFHYTNSFSNNVAQTGEAARQWLEKQDVPASVSIEALGFPEQTVIPVVSEYPNQFVKMSSEQITQAIASENNLIQSTNGNNKALLYILATEKSYKIVADQVYIVSEFGAYRLVITLNAYQNLK